VASNTYEGVTERHWAVALARHYPDAERLTIAAAEDRRNSSSSSRRSRQRGAYADVPCVNARHVKRVVRVPRAAR
jgi:hypothetical protein